MRACLEKLSSDKSSILSLQTTSINLSTKAESEDRRYLPMLELELQQCLRNSWSSLSPLRNCCVFVYMRTCVIVYSPTLELELRKCLRNSWSNLSPLRNCCENLSPKTLPHPILPEHRILTEKTLKRQVSESFEYWYWTGSQKRPHGL